MSDTLIASAESGFGFEMYADDDSVIITQDDATVMLSYDEAYTVYAALAEIFAEYEEDDEDGEYYEFAEE